MDLDSLEQGRARLSATYQNLTFTFEYHPERVGMNLQRALAAVNRPPHDMGPIVDELANILAAWDIQRKGEPVPITSEGVGSLPMAISSAIGRAIMEDFHNPKSPVALPVPSLSAPMTPSLGTSEPGGASVPAPTSPASFSAPDGRESPPGSSPAYLTPVAS